jgi:hypothetical protein
MEKTKIKEEEEEEIHLYWESESLFETYADSKQRLD